MRRLALIALFAVGSHAAIAASPAEERCILLNPVTIPAADIGLPTSGARVISAEFVPATGNGAAFIAEHCKVTAAIRPRDPTVPEIHLLSHCPPTGTARHSCSAGAFDGRTGAWSMPRMRWHFLARWRSRKARSAPLDVIGPYVASGCGANRV
jgi:hypothetical protein